MLLAMWIYPLSAQDETPAQRDARMTCWREARFGMFIHWGPYAQLGGVWDNKRIDSGVGNGVGEWIMYNAKIPVADYEREAAKFNPSGFDADLPVHGQVNWLGMRSINNSRNEGSVYHAFMNDAEVGEVSCLLDSRDVEGAALWPKAVHIVKGEKLYTKKWNGKSPVAVEKDGLTIVEWGVRR